MLFDLFYRQLHVIFNVSHDMRKMVQREGGNNMLKVSSMLTIYINTHTNTPHTHIPLLFIDDSIKKSPRVNM